MDWSIVVAMRVLSRKIIIILYRKQLCSLTFVCDELLHDLRILSVFLSLNNRPGVQDNDEIDAGYNFYLDSAISAPCLDGNVCARI